MATLVRCNISWTIRLVFIWTR